MFKKVLLYGFLLVFLLAAGLYLLRFQIATYVAHKILDERKADYLSKNPDKKLRGLLKQINEDAGALAAYPIFVEGSAGRSDASPFLNPLVGWGESKGRLTLPDAVTGLFKYKDPFQNLKLGWKRLNLDFSWFAKLYQYDHWAFDEHGPAYAAGATYTILELPIPQYGDLLVWAKLRLLNGRDKGEMRQAFKDVRQLARLIMSNENLVSTHCALGLFGFERAIFDSLPEPLRKTVNWKPMTLQDLEIAKRYYIAQASFVDLRLSDTMFQQLGDLSAGKCQRISQGIERSLGYRRIMKTEQQSAYARLNGLIQRTQGFCRPSFLRRMWADPEYEGFFRPDQDIFQMDSNLLDPNHPPKPPMFKTTISDLEKHPEFAVSLIYYLLDISEINYLRRYEEN